MKFSGMIGFIRTEETSPDVYTPKYTERHYMGDVLRNARKWSDKNEVNDDLNIQNRISIMADHYMTDNYGYMKYVVWNKMKWKITDIDLNYPRITLTLGGLWRE